MKKILTLADLKGKTQKEIKIHLATEYSEDHTHEYGEPDVEYLKMLKDYNILVAYESVGAWGCDSSSWFLLQHKGTKKLFEINGGHCSCYGFEGQGKLEEVPLEALKLRSGYDLLSTGGYDEDSNANTEAVRKYIQSLKP